MRVIALIDATYCLPAAFRWGCLPLRSSASLSQPSRSTKRSMLTCGLRWLLLSAVSRSELPSLDGDSRALTQIPYKGSGWGVTALLGGHATMLFVGPLAIESHVKAGRLRVLAEGQSSVRPIFLTSADHFTESRRIV